MQTTEMTIDGIKIIGNGKCGREEISFKKDGRNLEVSMVSTHHNPKGNFQDATFIKINENSLVKLKKFLQEKT